MAMTEQQEQALLALLDHMPALNSRLTSLEAVVSAVNQVPGAAELEQAAGSWLGKRIAALEAWAMKLGHNAPNNFTPAAPPTPTPTEQAAKA